jgi:hypothetical protein
MGQYYIIVNPVKKQFLNPHKFGAGLKLMEFLNTEYGPQMALGVLLSNGNGNGGGDLGTDGLTPEEVALIGSWAGDPVIVAGDYGEPWKFFDRAEYDQREYESKEELYRHSNGTVGTYEDMRSGSYSPTGKYRKVKKVFGTRKNRETGESEPHDENLYSVARTFFEDISDKMIAVIAKGEGGYHPWACMDLSDDGWRHPPAWGVLPEKEPKKPAGGKKLYKEYCKHAKSASLSLVDDVFCHVRSKPGEADLLLSLLAEKIKEAKKLGEQDAAELAARMKRGY